MTAGEVYASKSILISDVIKYVKRRIMSKTMEKTVESLHISIFGISVPFLETTKRREIYWPQCIVSMHVPV